MLRSPTRGETSSSSINRCREERAILSERAAQLEQQASDLRQLATSLRIQTVQKELKQSLRGPDDTIDLFHSALLIAKLDNPIPIRRVHIGGVTLTPNSAWDCQQARNFRMQLQYRTLRRQF